MRNFDENNLDALSASPLFAGVSAEKLPQLLSCLSAKQKSCAKGEYILRAGDAASHLGIVLSGRVCIVKEDFWGGVTVMGTVAAGGIFAEVYACTKARIMEASAVAQSHTDILFADIDKVLNICPSACEFHAQLLRNLVTVLAEKSLQLSRKAEYSSKKTLREKLLSYLSAQSLSAGAPEFRVPFDRQQLADYLGADRSALSAALSKLKREGVLDYHKNSFELKQDPAQNVDTNAL